MLSIVTILVLVNFVSAQRPNRRRRGIGAGVMAAIVLAICAILLLLCVSAIWFRRRARRGYAVDTGQSQSRFGMKPLFGGPWGRSSKGANDDGTYSKTQEPFDPNQDVIVPPPAYGGKGNV